MEGKKGFTLSPLIESFNKNFISRKLILREQKRAKELKRIIQQLLTLLLYKKRNSNLDLSQLKNQESELSEDILNLEQKKSKILKSLNSINMKIQERIYNTFNKYLPQIKRLKDEDETTALMGELQQIMSGEVSKIISLHFAELSKYDDEITTFRELELIIQNLLSQIDMGKDIGMVILIELLTLGTAGVAGAFGFFLRNSSKMLINQEGESRLKKTAKFIYQVNPLERIGDIVSAKLIEKEVIPRLKDLSKEIAGDINDELKVKIENEIFTPLEEELNLKQKMLNQLYKEKSKKLEEFTIRNKEIADDILELKLM